MEIEYIRNLIVDNLKKLQETYTFEVYFFGSILNTNDFNDVDIMIIYDSEIEVQQLKASFRNIKNIPLDLNFYTRIETIEFNFFKKGAFQKII
ncbi:hypothetical protein [Chryseobacterium wangxinyae]|uniref:hypothetical protein n=1 Tax=Chryseobacterium sp. CY353 TaxID=2997334 RepID=UPI002272154D|nr:hypothetical protein [Chryseobacterium sp. CY353]MCY0967970.1 hypothetical protein [Chryseobacterium sp. CY353]